MYEITDKIVGERRITVLRDLGVRAERLAQRRARCTIAARALEPHTKDILFALLYLLDAGGVEARLAASSGVDANSAGAIQTVEVGGTRDVWRFSHVAETKVAAVIEGLTAAMPCVPPGPWSDPPEKAVVLPIKSSLPNQLAGFLVAGVQPEVATR